MLRLINLRIIPIFYTTINRRSFTDMDPKSSSCSFLKLVDVHHPTKVEIPYDFATLLWGEQFPYGDRVKIFVADNLWIVEIEKIWVGSCFR
ncbi:hypothetical protein HanRHA438_Chr15g0715091 [Helianthus annuus]|nr:hypothetical protein HanPI659440_Chr15g0601991 [Helianthus annuus]KAJ0845562.1 hypothetical protein HanRHA438_Chr15g0715091 [Helianthus annuus]